MPDRDWVDAHGVTWRLCDRCDAPFKDGDQFWATVREGSYFQNLEYCSGCARRTIDDWTLQLRDIRYEDAP